MSFSSFQNKSSQPKHLLRYNNLNPLHFPKAHLKVINKLEIFQLSHPILNNVHQQRRTVQILKNNKYLHTMKLRLEKCSPSYLKKVVAQFKTFKGLHALQIDLLGFQSEGIREILAIPKELGYCGGNLRALRIDFTGSNIPFESASNIVSLFLGTQAQLTSLCLKFEEKQIFQYQNLVSLSKCLENKASCLRNLNLNFGRNGNLNSQGLQQLISKGLNNLPHLKNLNLNLKDSEPQESRNEINLKLALLKSQELVSLDLNLHQLKGCSFKGLGLITGQFKAWSSSLQTLVITFPPIYSESHRVFAESLGYLEALKTLKISMKDQDHLSIGILRSFIKALERLESLEVLDFDCFLENNEAEDLSEGIKKISKSLKNLQINLSRNPKITNQGMEKILKSLKELNGLETLTLNLKNCTISQHNMSTLASSIEVLKGLKKFTLSIGSTRTNSLGPGLSSKGPCINLLSHCLSRLMNLSTLELNFFSIGISDLEVMHLGNNLKKMLSLKKLTLLYDCPKDLGSSWHANFGNLFVSLKKLSTLRNLSISLDKINNEYLKALFSHLGGWVNLKSLHLKVYKGETLSYEAAKTFAKTMKTLSELESFHMCFYWASRTGANAMLELLKGLGELKCAENVKFDLVNTSVDYLAKIGENNLGEVQERVLTKFMNMRSLKSFYYMGEIVI